MKKTGIIVGLIVLLGLGGIAGGYYYFVQRPNITVGDDGIIFIQPGDSFETVMTTLISSGYVKNEYTLRKLAELKKYPSAVKTGRYRLVDKMNNNQLINMLRAGRQEPVHLTFNNIRTLEDFAAILSRQLGIDSTEFLQLARNAEYVKKLSFTPENFIGMFIPNTYQVYWHTPVEDFIQRMYKEYRKFWTEERLVKARKADLSPMDILILASIVEEETNIADEYPVIAGVYINRLNKGWKLEACPTLKFAWGDFSIRRVLDKHMEIDSPYNTYKNTGLPPGPVRMPSIRVIDAVLNYQHHDYMFFCAKSDFSGSHYFSRTLREHNRHANEYHRALNIKNEFIKKRQLYTYLPSVASVILKKVPAGNIDFINFTDFINFITQSPLFVWQFQLKILPLRPINYFYTNNQIIMLNHYETVFLQLPFYLNNR